MQMIKKDTMTSLEVLEQICAHFDENMDTYSDYDCSNLFLHLSKNKGKPYNLDKFYNYLSILCNNINIKDVFPTIELYAHISKLYNDFDFDFYIVLYEIYVHRMAPIVNRNGEKKTFLNCESHMFKIIDSFVFIKKEYYIKGKSIDMLGRCKKTGKYIIVEYKIGAKDGSIQLYGYDKMLGGDNILVNISENNVKNKQDGIIYITKDELFRDISKAKEFIYEEFRQVSIECNED